MIVMLFKVLRFLANKVAHLHAQLWGCYLILEIAYRTNKEPLTLWEHGADRIKKMRHKRIILKPVTRRCRVRPHVELANPYGAHCRMILLCYRSSG